MKGIRSFNEPSGLISSPLVDLLHMPASITNDRSILGATGFYRSGLILGIRVSLLVGMELSYIPLIKQPRDDADVVDRYLPSEKADLTIRNKVYLVTGRAIRDLG